MKKRLVAYLLVSALAVTLFAGCGKSGGGDADAAASADTGEAVVTEEADDILEDVTENSSDAFTDAVDEAAAIADTADAIAEETADENADEEPAEYVDDEDATEAVTGEAAAEEYFVPNLNEYYTVRFGGDVHAATDETSAVVYSANPGDQLYVVESMGDCWYKVTFNLMNDPTIYEGYILIQ